MNTKATITLLAFLGWSILCWRWYTCGVKEVCPSAKTGSEKNAISNNKESPPLQKAPLLFKENDADAITNDLFPAMRDSILKLVKEGKKLEITGIYYEGEQNTTAFENLGLARAEATKKLFAGMVDESKILLVSQMEKTMPEKVEGLIPATAFAISTPKGGVVEAENFVSIHFTSGSANRDQNAEVDAYLASLAEKLKTSDQKITITGHTDDTGNTESNEKLGMSRANHVKGILVKAGAKTENITCASKGELNPISDNSSEEGKRMNRRVEISLN